MACSLAEADRRRRHVWKTPHGSGQHEGDRLAHGAFSREISVKCPLADTRFNTGNAPRTALCFGETASAPTDGNRAASPLCSSPKTARQVLLGAAGYRLARTVAFVTTPERAEHHIAYGVDR